MFNELLYLSGNDIPFAEARLVIHQPTIKEIAYLGEETFYTGCEFLKFDKDILPEEDKSKLDNQTNFEVLIAIMGEQNITIQKQKICVMMVLSLLFPKYSIKLKENYISFIDNASNDKEELRIDKTNFEEFKKILSHMFCLDGDKENQTDYNPQGEMAKKIAEKLKKRHQRIAAEKNEGGPVSILSKYTSILAVGEQKDMNSLLNYTVYQLFDELRRYQLKIAWDMTANARLAGASDIKDAEDWMKDIHS